MKDKYDVIIVGTGVAGCFAAMHFTDDQDILMITKADIEESDSFLAQGGICVMKDDQDYESFFEDTLRAGHYENKKESVDIMIRSSREVIDELISYGVNFEESEGELQYTREGAHSTNRILYHKDVTGKEITGTLLKQVQQKQNVTIEIYTTMMDILCRGNTCEGIMVRTIMGDYRPVYAKNIIWACGGIGGIYDNTTNFPHLTGDALAIALKHGVQLKHVNYVQIHPTTLYSKKPGRRFLISESVRGEGAVLYNKNGERFVNELLPRDLLTKEIHKQMEKDRTPYVWLSMKEIKEMDINIRFPNICKRCREEGFDPMKEWIPVVPSQHYFMGGVEVDMQSMTSMQHLYAAGETSCNGVHGANRLASNSLLESLVFAKRAALAISNEIANDQEIGSEETVRMDLPWLQEQYGIYVNEYADSKTYFDKCKKRIWDEIKREEKDRKEKENESNHDQVKCG